MNQAKTLRVTYTTSSIGVKVDQKQTVRRLGLTRLGSTVELPDNPAVRGMLHKVRHLVTVEETMVDQTTAADTTGDER